MKKQNGNLEREHLSVSAKLRVTRELIGLRNTSQLTIEEQANIHGGNAAHCAGSVWPPDSDSCPP